MIVGSGPVGAPDDAANRKVDIVPSTTFEGTYTGNRYAPGEHEFGHAIGLPDEYKNITTGKLGDKQTAFTNLARAAGVATTRSVGRQDFEPDGIRCRRAAASLPDGVGSPGPDDVAGHHQERMEHRLGRS